MNLPFRSAVLLAVGPGAVELDRLADLGESLLAYAPDLARFLIVDDARRPDALLAVLPSALRPATRIIPNPRHGGELGWREGLNIGIWAGLRVLADEPAYEFILKLDTDSLLIAPALSPVSAVLQAHPGAGLIGTWRTDPAGQETGWRIFAPWIRLLTRRFACYRDPVTGLRRFRVAFGSRGRLQRRILASAFVHGYQPGEHCQGGGYTLAGHALCALRSAGYLHDPFLWARDPLTEDVALALCVKSLGFDFASANGPGQPFGVQYSGLAFPPAELLARGHAVIHSVKNAPAHPEPDLRAFFHAQRLV